MTETWLRRLAALAGTAMATGILIGSLIPNPPSPDVAQGDKLMHLAGYGVLAFCWASALPAHRLRVWLACALYGVLIEGLQGLTAYRSLDGWDMLANALGAALGWLAATLACRLARVVLDRRQAV
ncbi:VanZ family protein [Chitinimonas sp. BJYL2]|uniref:VanZ family protein n=1 Tax=Chitinimonas sp. BJYL2 TaxID=2976696 RepID=UPI0022B377DE|nr:VanZ family protein [Chitinimonas sp. BJYL2]